jgi:hypothetical protein
LTDHGELLLVWPWENKWEQLVEAAELNHLPGEYVTLWGFEWSNPILGHINILNTTDFTSILSNFGLASIYDWIIARPDAFARFNHPGQSTSWSRVQSFESLPQAVPQIVGIETWNKNDSFDVFSTTATGGLGANSASSTLATEVGTSVPWVARTIIPAIGGFERFPHCGAGRGAHSGAGC